MVESEQIWRDVRHEFVTANGGRWRADAAAAMIGMRTTEWSRYIHDQLGVALPPNEIAERVVKAVAQRMERVPVLPGATGALERFATAFRLGLATSAAMPVAQTVLKQTGWGKLFEVVVSSDEVARGKPAPDVYLRALELLDAEATRAVAIEDSANGIRSAHAAKLAVVAIPNREFPPDAQSLALASQVIPNLDALDANLVSELLNKESE
ncbi:MAG: HAD-IA family hydrolase [Candidatus Eremiobacteraeota bacterium]|nr:HAD-IA family hydrolase [Candidatus Eremiobacteraeota bacterium]